MPEIHPFRGIRYQVDARELARVLAPGYDALDERLAEELQAADPRNIVRVVRAQRGSDPRYEARGATYRGWMAAGLLAPERLPALYLLQEQFAGPEGAVVRTGLLARFRVGSPDRGALLPHAAPRSEVTEDRYRLRRATRADFCPLFVVFSDDRGRFASEASHVAAAEPLLGYEDARGVVRRLWRVDDPRSVNAFQAVLGSLTGYLAAGHDHYAAALRLATEDTHAGWALGCFTPLQSEGLLPTACHRVFRNAPDLDAVRASVSDLLSFGQPCSPGEALAAVEASRQDYAYAFVGDAGRAVVAESLPEAHASLPEGTPPALRGLDAVFLDEVLARRLRLGSEDRREASSLAEVGALLAEGEGSLGVLLRPASLRQMMAAAQARAVLPPGSLQFSPALPSGLVIHQLAG